MIPVVQPDAAKGDLDEVPYRMWNASGNDIVIWDLGLKNAPHRFDIVRCVPPIDSGIEIADFKYLGHSAGDACSADRDLSREEVWRTQA